MSGTWFDHKKILYIHKTFFYFFQNNQIIAASCLLTLTIGMAMRNRFNMIGLMRLNMLLVQFFGNP